MLEEPYGEALVSVIAHTGMRNICLALIKHARFPKFQYHSRVLALAILQEEVASEHLMDLEFLGLALQLYRKKGNEQHLSSWRACIVYGY